MINGLNTFLVGNKFISETATDSAAMTSSAWLTVDYNANFAGCRNLVVATVAMLFVNNLVSPVAGQPINDTG